MLLVGVAIGYHLAGGEYLFRLRKLMREVKEIPVAANEVRVIASKYAWHFHYAGKDGVLGAASHKAMLLTTLRDWMPQILLAKMTW